MKLERKCDACGETTRPSTEDIHEESPEGWRHFFLHIAAFKPDGLCRIDVCPACNALPDDEVQLAAMMDIVNRLAVKAVKYDLIRDSTVLYSLNDGATIGEAHRDFDTWVRKLEEDSRRRCDRNNETKQ